MDQIKNLEKDLNANSNIVKFEGVDVICVHREGKQIVIVGNLEDDHNISVVGKNRSKRRKVKTAEEIAASHEKYFHGNTNLQLMRKHRVISFLHFLNQTIRSKQENENGVINVVSNYYVVNSVLQRMLLIIDGDDFRKESNPNMKLINADSMKKWLMLYRQVANEEQPILYGTKSGVLCRKNMMLSGFFSALGKHEAASISDSEKKRQVVLPDYSRGVIKQTAFAKCSWKFYDVLQFDGRFGPLANMLSYVTQMFERKDVDVEARDQWEDFVSKCYRECTNDKQVLSAFDVQNVVAFTSGLAFKLVKEKGLKIDDDLKGVWTDDFCDKVVKFSDTYTCKRKSKPTKPSTAAIKYMIETIVEFKNRQQAKRKRRLSYVEHELNDTEKHIKLDEEENY